MSNRRKAIIGGRILTPTHVIGGGYVLVEGDRVAALGRRSEGLPSDVQVFDAPTHWVTPGLIDLHIHGALGRNVMGSGLADVARELAKRGVTSFLPTTLTAPLTDLRAALATMAEAATGGGDGARPVGIHLEGPHLSPGAGGMADRRHLRPLKPSVWDELQRAARGMIRMVTFAPEEGEGMRLIPRLIREGVVPSIGHSVATFEQVSEMVSLGLGHASHMFNAMGPFHHRKPGVVGAVLYHQEITAQLVADLQHVHPAAMELLFRLKGPDRVALVSDASPVAGLPPGEYAWDAHTRVRVHEDGTSRLLDGTLAGATTFLNQGVLNLVEALALPWTKALTAATVVPGEALSVQRGRLRPGWVADLVVWDQTFRPQATMVEGRWVWRRNGTDPQSGSAADGGIR